MSQVMSRRYAGGEFLSEISPLWTPLNLATVPPIYIDAEDSTIILDTGAISAITNLGTMGTSGDLFQPVAARRPTVLEAELNGKKAIRFDGIDDLLEGNTAAQKDHLRNVGTGWAFHIVKKRLTDADQAAEANRLIFFCESGGTGGSRLSSYHGRSQPGEANKPTVQTKRLDADLVTTLTSPATASAYNMRLDYVDYTGGTAQMIINGTIADTDVLASSGNTSDTTANRAMSIGAIVGPLLNADIDMAALLSGNTALTQADINKLFGWAAHKYGLTALLPANHTYKTEAPSTATYDQDIGIAWTPRTSAVDNTWVGVAWSPELSLFAAISTSGTSNKIMTSPDGITWTARVNPVNNNWACITWASGLGLFVAVSNTGTGDRVMTSPDGINWTTRVNALDIDWRAIAWSPELNLLVVVASGGVNNRVMTSPDGINWTLRITPVDNAWIGVAWSSSLSLFVAAANSGTSDRVMTSPDGINWTARTTPVDNNWFGMTWAAELGLFVVVGLTGVGNRVMTSPDGINWTARTTPVDNNWASVAWSPERGLLVAVSLSGTNDRVMTSPDGINWTTRTTPVDNNWRFVTWAPALNRFVAVGTTGTGNRVMTSL